MASGDRLRVLFLNHNVACLGTYYRAFRLGQQLARRGHEVTLVTTHPTRRMRFEERREGNLEIIMAPDWLWDGARQGWGPVNAARRILRLRGRHFDLIHAFDSRPAVVGPALTVRRDTGALLVMDWADWWGRGGTIQQRSGWPVRTLFGPIETWFEEAFRTLADGTTVISHALEERARQLGVAARAILRFPHGCDPDGLRPQDQSQARGRLGLPPGGRLLVHLGVLTRADAALLFDALRTARGEMASLTLALVGNPRVPVPAALIESGAVHLAGFVPQEAVATWLAAADLCVVPLSDTVGNRGRWPSKINDYFAAGRPTLITRVGDAADVAERHGAGFISDPAPRALAATLVAALAAPAALRSAGARARDLAETELSWTRLADQVLEFYGSLTGRR